MTKKSQNSNSDKKKTYYHRKAWKVLRLEILREHPYCRMCLKKRIFTKATHIDHINGFNNEDEFFDRDNLQALCLPCHSSKTHAAGGDDWLRRRKAKLGVIEYFDY